MRLEHLKTTMEENGIDFNADSVLETICHPRKLKELYASLNYNGSIEELHNELFLIVIYLSFDEINEVDNDVSNDKFKQRLEELAHYYSLRFLNLIKELELSEKESENLQDLMNNSEKLCDYFGKDILQQK
ncbi:hypothetical protein A0H77_19605 [Vibrio alginolyticus]|uniref:hypothetical protein n=1 Tax=Vibrio alginolyticus TaxID=663 RepID=UPI0007966B4F|nr:hypothetical protein [Vibrio alginolyticus]KXZ35105.1 hypothetical protein A0H77_19605 [Vibrio alginolyticus]